jgi:hypothetical protein
VIRTKLHLLSNTAGDLSRYSFGATSAIITSLALVVGLDSTANPKMSIVSTLLVIAFADNISDSLGIHVYRESQYPVCKHTEVYTFSNFLTRLAITMLFVFLVLYLPMQIAVPVCMAIGLLLLCLLSYFIAIYHKSNPLWEIFEPVGVAVVVLIASHFLSRLIPKLFGI